MKEIKYKYPAWKRQWMRMSAGISFIFGSSILMWIVVDYLNNFKCQIWYGFAATETAIIYAIAFGFHYLAERRKKG